MIKVAKEEDEIVLVQATNREKVFSHIMTIHKGAMLVSTKANGLGVHIMIWRRSRRAGLWKKYRRKVL